jgi:hypothetical protein
MKRLSESDRRLKDRVDLQALFEVCGHAELTRAAVADALISARGYARGKDLRGLLARWTAQERPDLTHHLGPPTSPAPPTGHVAGRDGGVDTAPPPTKEIAGRP